MRILTDSSIDDIVVSIIFTGVMIFSVAGVLATFSLKCTCSSFIGVSLEKIMRIHFQK